MVKAGVCSCLYCLLYVVYFSIIIYTQKESKRIKFSEKTKSSFYEFQPIGSSATMVGYLR